MKKGGIIMKKFLKKLVAGFSVLTVMSMSILSASAWSVLESDEYKSYIEKTYSENQRYSDDVKAKWLEEYKDFDYGGYIDIYYSYKGNADQPMSNQYLYRPYETTKLKQTNVTVVWDSYSLSSDAEYIPTEDEINQFLKENNLGAYVASCNSGSIKLEYDFDVTLETTDAKFQAITDALCDEYGFKNVSYSDLLVRILDLGITAPTVGNDKVTLAGDIDLDNDTGLADIVILSKYMSNNSIYPITDETARANADVNNDSEINVLDMNILVEMQLGNYESAV